MEGKWISIKDRLPNLYDEVIVFHEGNSQWGRHVTVGQLREVEFGSLINPEKRLAFFGETLDEECELIVNYWMPLPYPPKEK